LWTLDRLGRRYGQKPSSWFPLFSDRIAWQIDNACMSFGQWYDARMSEYRGEGKNRKPVWQPWQLLGLDPPKRQLGGRSIADLNRYAGLPGVNIRNAPGADADTDPALRPRPPWAEGDADADPTKRPRPPWENG
jgi:hypothetical protein